MSQHSRFRGIFVVERAHPRFRVRVERPIPRGAHSLVKETEESLIITPEVLFRWSKREVTHTICISNAIHLLNKMKVNVVHCPEAVPKKLESKLPPRSDGSGSVGHGSDSDSSWDEASAIDGHAWWESGSEDEVRLARRALYRQMQILTVRALSQ